MKITIFENIFSDKPSWIPVELALKRIKEGKSKELIEKIRQEEDHEKRNNLKKRLPCVCFSGKFNERKDSSLIEHSGFIVLDFDHVDTSEYMSVICGYPFVYAAWISPSGDGVKALCKLSNLSKHRQHYTALKKVFPDADKSGINESRVCYESYDPNIYINTYAIPYEELVEIEIKQDSTSSSEDIQKLVKWLAKENRYFVTGERNSFIFILACACCRYGIDIEDCKQFCYYEFYQTSSDFTKSEGDKAIDSAYRTEKKNFGTVSFKKEELVNSKGEKPVFEQLKEGDRVKDVVYGDDVYTDVYSIINKGRQGIKGIGVEIMDKAFKQMRGQVNLLTGYGNQGKSAWLKWYLVCRAILFGEKFALFPPEEGGAEEFYLSIMEIILGCDLTPTNTYRPSKEKIDQCFEFVKKHFFYIYPQDVSPTPEYIKERFMYLMVTEKVDGLVIDPFNQMTNDYKGYGGRSDKYLEYVLSDFDRFAQINNIYFWIVAHPIKPQKNKEGGYDAPTEYDLADGAMWANKIYNILAYHRPSAWQDPKNPTCELYCRKIKKVGVNGSKGFIEFAFEPIRRRFIFDGYDVLASNFIAKDDNISTFEKESKKVLEQKVEIVNFDNEYDDMDY